MMSIRFTSKFEREHQKFNLLQTKVGAVALLLCWIRISIAFFSLPGRNSEKTTKNSKGVNMAGQHTENLFRRFKGEAVSIKTVSGGLYEGRVTEITNDYICLIETVGGEGVQVFLFFHAIESVTTVANTPV